MVVSHRSNANSAYIDLLRTLRDDEVSDLKGTPAKRTTSGKVYWYDRYRIGNDIRERYIGPDSPELRERLERHQALKQGRDARQKYRATLIRVLRAENYNMPTGNMGRLILALARAGVFRLGGTLVGTMAFQLYEGELGVRMIADGTSMTDDMDIASFEKLAVTILDTADPDLSSVFEDLSFRPVPTLHNAHVWKWTQGPDMTVEFLTPALGEEQIVRLPTLGVSAQGLHFLNYLIVDPIPAAFLYRSGVLVQIPRPERFAIHKLIVADRRKVDQAKGLKDLAQAEFLIDVLAEDRPDDLAEAYRDAMGRGEKWEAHITRSLRRLSAETREKLTAG